MSFARKIKTWGLATVATVATTEHEKVENEPSVAQVATVAKGPTFKNEVVEVHDPRLRHRLEANGLSADDAMALAVKLHGRKADFDDRQVCFECQHFARGLCRNAIRAGLSVRLPLMPVPEFFDQQLQRCPGFALADF